METDVVLPAAEILERKDAKQVSCCFVGICSSLHATRFGLLGAIALCAIIIARYFPAA
jgi:hypothetical protein